MIVWYLTIPLVRKCKAVPVLLLTVVLALTAGYFKNVGDFLCLSRILVFGPFFLSGLFSGAEDTGKSIAAKVSETGGSMRGGNLYLYSGIWSKVERFPGNGI